MKKKAIEKIPYLTLPKISQKKDVKYIGITAYKTIDNQRHLFLEVYRNKKENKDVPMVRIVLNKKDFGTFFPSNGLWSRGQITKNTWSNYGLIWRENEEQIHQTVDIMAKENALHSQEDMERIKKFTGVKIWNETEWWECIEIWQKDIIETEYRERSKRKYERRQQALRERQERTPELPNDRILEYADQFIFHELHYLYYKKHGVRATIACSKCGGVSDERWKPGISYESQFVKTIQEPKMGEFGTCPMCKAVGKYMPQGRVRSSNRVSAYLFLGQKYKENGMVFRYIEVGKEWQLQLICNEKGEPEMYNSCEKLDGIEIARAYFEPGKKVQKDFQKHNTWSGKDFWDDCNLSGLSNIIIKDAQVLPETYQNMKGTFLQYSAMKEFQTAAGVINPVDYIDRYIQTPQIEMLTKMKLIGVVKELLKCHYGIVADINAKRIEEFLGIRKERVERLISRKGDPNTLKIMQLEKRLGQKWTNEQLEQIMEINLGNEIMVPLEYMGIQKLLNKIAKYAGCEYGTMCGTAIARLQHIARTYVDYLNMKKNLRYDLQNTVHLFPKDLEAAHGKMVMESNKKEADKRIREVNEQYPLIKKNYRKLRKKFYFEDEEFMIRPARDAGEIVMEGRMLHHCVGGDNYLNKHDTGKSIILFLRFKAEPDIPYITVEIENDMLKIVQWYGQHDKKPDEKRMQKWLGAYITRLKCRRDGISQEIVNEAAIPVLAYA